MPNLAERDRSTGQVKQDGIDLDHGGISVLKKVRTAAQPRIVGETGRPKMANTKASNPKSAGGSVKAPMISDNGLVLAVYILYLVGLLNGLTAVIGVIIAYMQRDKADPVSQTHFLFQMKTFLIGLLYLFLSAATFHVGLGMLILLWWVIWTVIRCVKGLLALNAGEPIGDPNSWLFG